MRLEAFMCDGQTVYGNLQGTAQAYHAGLLLKGAPDRQCEGYSARHSAGQDAGY